MNSKREEEFNVALGRRLMVLRSGRKWSQEYVGAQIGVRHQQVHKYETGENGMTPQRVQICAKLFEVPVSYFYGEEDKLLSEAARNIERYDREIMGVAAEIYLLPPKVRKGLYSFCRILNIEIPGKEGANTKLDNEQAA